MRRNKIQVLSKGKVISKKNKIQKEMFKNPDSVCINRSLGGIGDVLMCTVALREFKRENPKSRLHFAIDQSSTYDNTYYKLIKNAPFIDEILDSKFVRSSRYDFYKDITTVCIMEERGSKYPRGRIEIFSEAINVKNIQNTVPFYLETNEEKEEMDVIFKQYNGKKKFFIHTASNEGKRSYNINNTVSLVKMIKEEYKDCVIFISDFNKLYSSWDSIGVVNISDLDIRDTASYIKRCDLFIGPDSGLMHLAAAVHTKSLVIFGSIPPETRVKYYKTHSSIVLEGLSCLGCWYKPCPHNIRCMKDLKAERVFKKITRMI